jgi:hypothetical protein
MDGLTTSGTIVIAVLGSFNAIVAVIGAVLIAKINNANKAVKEIKSDTTATRDQVVNHHTTNFRDETDNRHNVTTKWLESIWRKLNRQDDRLDEYGDILKDLRRRANSNRDRITDLEEARELAGKENDVRDTDLRRIG